MCGICGFVGDRRFELLEPMCHAMSHRGPDDMGFWHDADCEVGLGQCRLSIIDLSSAGHQPMSDESGKIWISFNGEIYGFQEHRQHLLSQGHNFRGHSDTEVLVHLYAEYGISFLDKLNGMFALAIWDSNRRELLLARDHAGIKPLYYWQNGNRLYFASEIKALLRLPEIRRELNRAVIPEYITLLWVAGDQTMFKDIMKVEPGHYLIWKNGRIEIKQWFTLPYWPDESVSENEWVERTHDVFRQSVKRQMVSDVPLGAFLSGGVDSSGIVACMRNCFPEREINCYSARIDPQDESIDQFIDDFPYAKQVAEVLNVNLKSFVLRPDVMQLLPKMVYHLDEPDADPAIFPSYLISKLAREDGTTVLLSGTGGDEVFFGYRSHQTYRLYEYLEWFPRWLISPTVGMLASTLALLKGSGAAIPRRLRKFRNGLITQGLDRYMAVAEWSDSDTRTSILSAEVTAELKDQPAHPLSIKKYFDSFIGCGQLNQRSHVLIQTFLAAHNFLYTDKSSMATSLEVRVPFMDMEVMKLCAQIPERYKLKGSITKYVFKEALERYIPRNILHRSKTGFGVPLRKWIVDDLKPLIAELLSPENIETRGIFNSDAVHCVIADNEAGRADYAYLIYALLNLEMWQQTFIDRPGEEVSL